jgi:cysteine desulfurase
LDHSATTPVRPEVLEAMLPYFCETFGNPSSLHDFGKKAQEAIYVAREQVAEFIKARPEEIVFTSGGTESNNMALRGVFHPLQCRGRRLVISSVEHKSVLSTATHMQKEYGLNVRKVAVDSDCLLQLDDLEMAVTAETSLVSVMHVNNETGALQPLREVAELCQRERVLLHTDAVQAVGMIRVDVNDPPVDFLSLSAHKIGGPKGVGACYVRNGSALLSILTGGGQQHGLRAGTENVPGIVGLGMACDLIYGEMSQAAVRLKSLRDVLEERLLTVFPFAKTNGSKEKRVPHILNIAFVGIEGETLVMTLNQKGIQASSGSACSSGSAEPSHVLMAMGQSAIQARSGVRFSLGHGSVESDIRRVEDALLQFTSVPYGASFI